MRQSLAAAATCSYGGASRTSLVEGLKASHPQDGGKIID